MTSEVFYVHFFTEKKKTKKQSKMKITAKEHTEVPRSKKIEISPPGQVFIICSTGICH